jgi:hypothetical protein
MAIQSQWSTVLYPFPVNILDKTSKSLLLTLIILFYLSYNSNGNFRKCNTLWNFIYFMLNETVRLKITWLITGSCFFIIDRIQDLQVQIFNENLIRWIMFITMLQIRIETVHGQSDWSELHSICGRSSSSLWHICFKNGSAYLLSLPV